MAQYPANIDLSSLDGTNGFKISGEAAYDHSGFSVASAGDVNGDGIPDLIIGAPGTVTHGNYSGASYVVFGKASGFSADLNLSSLDGTNGFKLSGEAPYDNCGFRVSSAGDINGDGFADVVVGALDAGASGADNGASYVVFGKASGFAANIDLSSLDGTNGFKLSGVADSDESGRSVSNAGDVNGDGIDDLIIGAADANSHGLYSGASYVVFGKASGFSASFDLSSLDGTNGFKLSGVAVGDESSTSVSSAGDVNGDGFNDLIIGAPGASPHGLDSGASYVVFGKASGFAANIDLSGLDGTNGFKLSGVSAHDLTGYSVASAGDVNGDGFSDLIIGAAKASPHGSGPGATYVVFGKAGGFAANIDLSSLNGINGFKISGVNDSTYSGSSVASAGDVNGDGFDDLIIGACGAGSDQSNIGAAYVVFGKASGFAANIDLASLDGTNGFKLSGIVFRDATGFSVSSAGDLNGDGLADLIVGAPGADHSSGASYVVYGRLPDTAVDRVGTVASQNLVGGNFSDTLSGMGGNDKLYGNGGDDTLTGGTGNDALYGGAGYDVAVMSGPQAHYTITASGDGFNIVDHVGTDGSDHITGVEAIQFSDGVLTLGGGGGETITGTAGPDTLTGTSGPDHIDGRAGDDVISAGSGNDFARGANGNDTISGGLGDDTLQGGQGDDTLYGGAGADVLRGGVGDDVLAGGTGHDILSGLAGADTFVFGPAAAADSDVITDFTHGTDRLAFHAGDYGLPAGALSPGDLVFGPAATDAHAEFVYDAAHKALLWDPDGAGGTAAITVATFTTAITLTASDFIILA